MSRIPAYRILLVDDHAFVRRAMRRLLEGDPALRVCAEAATFRQALKEIRRDPPDLAIMDLVTPGEHALQFIRAARKLRPALRILVVSLHKESLFAESALRAGADGFLMKSDAADRLVDAAHTVLGGRIYLSAAMQQALFERMRGVERSGARTRPPLARHARFETRRGLTGRRRVHSSAR
jgi:DNA-binding NarL/FixJ family response regulator